MQSCIPHTKQKQLFSNKTFYLYSKAKNNLLFLGLSVFFSYNKWQLNKANLPLLLNAALFLPILYVENSFSSKLKIYYSNFLNLFSIYKNYSKWSISSKLILKKNYFPHIKITIREVFFSNIYVKISNTKTDGQ